MFHRRSLPLTVCRYSDLCYAMSWHAIKNIVRACFTDYAISSMDHKLQSEYHQSWPASCIYMASKLRIVFTF